MSDTPPLSSDLAQSELEALFEAMFLAAFADDDFTDEERRRFQMRVLELSQGRIRDDGFDELLARVTRQLFADGLAARLRVIAERLGSASSRRLAIRLAADVAAHDRLQRRETHLLQELGQVLGLPDDEVQRLVAARVD